MAAKWRCRTLTLTLDVRAHLDDVARFNDVLQNTSATSLGNDAHERTLTFFGNPAQRVRQRHKWEVEEHTRHLAQLNDQDHTLVAELYHGCPSVGAAPLPPCDGPLHVEP